MVLDRFIALVLRLTANSFRIPAGNFGSRNIYAGMKILNEKCQLFHNKDGSRSRGRQIGDFQTDS